MSCDNYWPTIDASLKASDGDDIGLTFKDGSGNPLDISLWTDKVYKASGTHTTDVIDVANAAMTNTSSGTGVTDTIVIPRSYIATDIDPGKYTHEFRAKVSGVPRTIFDGTLVVVATIATVP